MQAWCFWGMHLSFWNNWYKTLVFIGQNVYTEIVGKAKRCIPTFSFSGEVLVGGGAVLRQSNCFCRV